LHNNVSKFQYDTCECIKHHWVSVIPSLNKSSKPFVIVHMISGVLRELFLYLDFLVYFVIDDYSKTTWVYLLKDKSDVLSIFRCFRK
jgi:hypothetical protein